MKKLYFGIVLFLFILTNNNVWAQIKSGQNPIIFADVPDMSMIRVADT